MIEYVVKSGDTLGIICAAHPELGYKSWIELKQGNIEEILRVGRGKMVGIPSVTAETTRHPCGLSGHSARHSIFSGIHYDDEKGTEPTIYPGTTLKLKSKKENKDADKDEEEKKAEEEDVASEKIYNQAGKEFKKANSGWFGIKHQSPAPRLEVFTSGNPNKADLVYEGDAKGNVQSKLLAYTFSEAVDDLIGSFSFTVENEKIGSDGRTTFDAIPKRSVVKIYEADDKLPVFIGIVKKRRIKSSMTSQGPKRTIMFSGKSIISIIAEYMVSLDFKIMKVPHAENESRKLKDRLKEKNPLSIKDFMSITWDFFLEMGTGEKSNAIGSTEMGNIVKNFIGENIFDYITGDGNQNMHYPIANAPFNQSNNVIADLWRNILPQPVYEIFAFCDRKDGKPKIMARESPFGFPDTNNQDWYNRDIYEIDPLDLTDYDISQSDDEVYTVFSAYLIGASMSREFNIAKDQDKQDDIFATDSKKMGIYGFKPLEISFRGYDKSYIETDDRKNAFKELNEKARYWYGRLDDMFSGTITVITDFIKPKDNETDRNPRVGCRARFLGGEFYINKADHRWTYGGTPTITLGISRGMEYGDDGYQVSGELGILSDVGKQFKELE